MYGEIGNDFWGEGISADRFQKELKALGNVRTIDLHIDSGGGSVLDARAIYTLLTQHKATINVKIDGLAASAASFIAMAGDSIAIAEGGFLMIHNARGVARGTADDMRKAAAVVDQVDGTIVDTYVARTKKSRSQIRDWMKAETWFTGSDAVNEGFADEVMENKQITNCIHPRELLDSFGKLPLALRPNQLKARQIAARIRKTLDENQI